MATNPTPSNPRVVDGFRHFARLTAWLMLALGLLVLAGSSLQLPTLTTVLPGSPAMKASTALAFVCSGAALLSFLRHGPGRAKGCALWSSAATMLGALSLGEYLFDVDLAVDHWFPDPVALEHGLHPGRMSQLTAAGFVLLGSRALLSCTNRAMRLRDALSIALLTIAMIGMAAFGYASGGGHYSATPFEPMAIHTALLLLLAALAWMSAEPTRGMTRLATADSLGGAVARRLLLPALLLPLLISFLTQWLQVHFGMGASLTASLSAVASGGAVASLIWWVSYLLDRVEQERRESQQFRTSAETDGLTGLANRRAFDAALQRLLQGHRESDPQFCLLMLDLDHFKSFNDSFGHLAGDEALRTAARLLRNAVRPGDQPARYGGEEFAVLLPGSDGEAARQVSERILRLFRDEPWPDRLVTVSIGAAEAVPGDDASSLIARADAALYQAKDAGRDRVVLQRNPIGVVDAAA